jgi:hypothetical protein
MTVDYEPIVKGTAPDQIRAVAQDAQQQHEGLGLRVQNKAEFTLIAPLVPGGADELRKRATGKGQLEAGWWEGSLGTVHDLRIVIFDDGASVLFAATYSDDFKPYVDDVIKFATPWLDYMFVGTAVGYPGTSSPDAVPWILKYTVQASLWYASHPDLSVRDITRSVKISSAWDTLVDASQQ